jgi:hypothetical protein
MPAGFDNTRRQFERGVVILSFDTEQIWGYLDLFDESQFHRRYPGAFDAHTKLIASLSEANVRATWFLVGGMALRGSMGNRDRRMAGLPYYWTSRIPAGDDADTPLWYRPSLVEALSKARPPQEIGLHGGLTHLIWTDPLATREVVEWELSEGVRALDEAFANPVSFSFAREQEAHHELLPAHGFHCYRGRTVAPSFRLGPTVLGKAARLFDEMRRATPRVVWPQQTLPGLWNIPSSVFLYPIHPSRTRVVALRSRLERFVRGIDAAVRHRGIFHYCLHPENLTEAPQGFALFDEMLQCLDRARARGDIEILTMGDVAARMQSARRTELSRCHFRHATRSLIRVK